MVLLHVENKIIWDTKLCHCHHLVLLRPPTLKLFIFFRNFRIIRWYFFRSFRSIRRYFFRNFRIIRQDTIIANTYKKKTFLMASSSITPYSHSISTFLLNKKMVQQALKITYLQEWVWLNEDQTTLNWIKKIQIWSIWFELQQVM